MFHRRESALYRPGLREQAAGFDGIRSISRLCGKSPSCEWKFRGATGKRAFHEIEAGKNHAADESSVAPQDIHRGCSARGDHEARAAENRPGSDQRGPAVRPELVRPPIAAVDCKDHPGLSESSPLWKRSIPPVEASMSAPSSATPTTLPSATRRPACDKATRLPFQAWRCSHSSRNGAKPSRENRARTSAMDSSAATSTEVRDGTASLWLAISVAGPSMRSSA